MNVAATDIVIRALEKDDAAQWRLRLEGLKWRIVSSE